MFVLLMPFGQKSFKLLINPHALTSGSAAELGNFMVATVYKLNFQYHRVNFLHAEKHDVNPALAKLSFFICFICRCGGKFDWRL